MKRILVLLAVLLMIGTSICFAEEAQFDPNVLAELDGYSYDRFEKSWSYYGAYLMQYTDATVVVGVKASGNKEYLEPVYIYAWVRDASNMKVYSVVKELMILADDTLITIPMMEFDASSGMFITPSSNEVLNIIGNAKQLAFKLVLDVGSVTLEPAASEVAEFTAVARNIYAHNIASYVRFDDATLKYLEETYPITVE